MNQLPAFMQLLQALGSRSAGDGCPNAGADVIVAMFGTLAGVSHPDSAVVTQSGISLPVGIDVLSVCPVLSKGIEAHVADPLRAIQNQIFRDTASRKAMRLRDEANKTIQKPAATFDTGEAYEMMDKRYLTLPEIRNQAARWGSRSQSQAEAEARNHPVVFLDGMTSKDCLGESLKSAHLQRALVKIGIANAAEYSAALPVFQGITRGLALDDAYPFQATGRVLGTIERGTFAELVTEAYQPSGLTGAMLWLTGTELGDVPLASASDPAESNPHARYLAALKEVISRRFEDEPINIVITPEMLESCYQFRQQLRCLEPECPGIAAALCNLLPTLNFGVSLLYSLHSPPRLLPYHPEVLTGWATALAHRMVQVRKDLIRGSWIERLAQLGDDICRKLSGSPALTDREITRKFNNLRIGPCREALEILHEAGRVECRGDRWQLASSAPSATISQSTDHYPR